MKAAGRTLTVGELLAELKGARELAPVTVSAPGGAEIAVTMVEVDGGAVSLSAAHFENDEAMQELVDLVEELAYEMKAPASLRRRAKATLDRYNLDQLSA